MLSETFKEEKKKLKEQVKKEISKLDERRKQKLLSQE